LIDRAKKCKKPLIISECGGYTLAVKNHLWNPKAKYGYGSCSYFLFTNEKLYSLFWLRDWSGAKRSEVNKMNEGMERLARNLGNGPAKQGKNSLADCF